MASISTPNRIDVPAAKWSSRVNTYIPPWRGRGEKENNACKFSTVTLFLDSFADIMFVRMQTLEFNHSARINSN